MKICSSALNRGLQLPSGKSGTSPHPERFIAACPLHKETPMLKTLITVATVLLTTAAFAQSSTKSYAPGQKMQKSTTSTAPGASEYAPGHKKKTAKGHSQSAPGQTTGSATKKT